MELEKIVEKIVPATLLILIASLFTMYMDVQALKAIAKDYKERADEAHACYAKETRSNREKHIIVEEKLKTYDIILKNNK